MLASRLRLWFGLSDRVDRRAYFATGLGFMALKYLSDSAVVWAYTGRVWSPLDYANPVWSVREHALQGVPSAVVLALAVCRSAAQWTPDARRGSPSYSSSPTSITCSCSR